MPANQPTLRGYDETRAWYAHQTGDYEMNIVTEINSVDVVGDVAVTTGTFRVTRAPEDGVAGLDHGGRWLSVLRRVDGKWKMWRDMDTPSPDADVSVGACHGAVVRQHAGGELDQFALVIGQPSTARTRRR